MKLKQMADLHRRLIVSSVVGALIAFLIIFSSSEWVGALLVLTVAGIVSVGVWEYAQLAKAKDLRVASFLMIATAACFTFSFFAGIKMHAFSGLPFMVLAAGIIALFLHRFKDPSNALVHLGVEFFGVCYIAVPISLFLGILYVPTAHMHQDGRWWLVYLILVTKITDIGAYFVGRLWGKRPLAPVLSPKKTVEGAIAGFLCAVAMSLALSMLGKKVTGFHLELLPALILGMLIGILGQVGDLAESLLKRDADRKDSNKLPGLGGVLDMVDSLLFTAPIVYFFLKLL